ncbi:MAG: hypothetical protein GQ534_07985 [Candidatus Delongbacteria bacterium]|nr:hypothetical protein [Candidatus Delongbacteria bacterium]
MKKIRFIIFTICILILISCSQKKNYTVEVKDGVEIITNKNIESSPKLKLDLKLISDISLDSLVLPDSIPAMESFSMTALDNDGNIYISHFGKSIVYKLDENANYVTNFHRKGQGPGESIVINDIKTINDSVYVFGEYGKTAIYSKLGNFIRQVRLLDGKYRALQILISDDNIFCYSRNITYDMEEKIENTTLGVYLLGKNNLESYSKILEINSTVDLNNYRYLMNDEQRRFSFYNGQIYVEDLSFTNYAVDIYDLHGKKRRRIEKQTRKIACSDKFKDKIKKKNQRGSSVKFIADYMKQILWMYVDKNENLWIKPAIEGLEFDHQFFDIFNSEGIFLKRIKFPLPDSFKLLIFDKSKLIAIDRDNCIVKVFKYDFINHE